jgi:hypothetical protein
MNLELDVPEVNLLLEALGEMPAKKSYQLLGKILIEAQKQNAQGGPMPKHPEPSGQTD